MSLFGLCLREGPLCGWQLRLAVTPELLSLHKSSQSASTSTSTKTSLSLSHKLQSPPMAYNYGHPGNVGSPAPGGFHAGDEEARYQSHTPAPYDQQGYDEHQPPFLHAGYGHQETYSSDRQYEDGGDASNRFSAQYGHQGYTQGQDQHGYPPIDDQALHSPMGEGDNGQPPHHNIHWLPATQHPGGQPEPDAGLYPSYTGGSSYDLHTGGSTANGDNLNPFDAPPVHERLGSNEDFPLLNQNGAPIGGMHAPGGFVDPTQGMNGEIQEHDDDDTAIRYGHIPRRVPRRLKTVKQGS